MALPASPPIRLTAIRDEVNGSSSGNAVLTTLVGDALPSVGSLPAGLTNFLGHTQTTSPPAPGTVTLGQTNFTCTPYQYTVTWTASAGATSYDVQIKNLTGDNLWYQVGNVSSSPFNGSDSSDPVINEGNFIIARVKANNAGGSSAWVESSEEQFQCSTNEK